MATSFDLGGLLGNAFGSNLSSLNDLLTDEQRAAIQRQAGLSAAAALLQAAGPSTTPTSLGQALGSAFTAGQTGMQKGTESALTQMLTRQKLDEAKRAQEYEKRLAGIFGTPQEAALAAPGMPPGPTVQRAALIGQPSAPGAEPVRDNETRARQYRQAADLAIIRGRPQDAKLYAEMAEGLAPSRKEVSGAPFEATDERGNPVLIQGFKDGTREVVSGFGPKREVVLQNVGNRIIAVDKSKLKGGEELSIGMSPAEERRIQIEEAQLKIAQQRLGLSQAEFNRGAYERVQTSDGGLMYVSRIPGVPSIPVLGPNQQPLTGPEAKPPEAFNKAARQLADLRGSIKDYKDELEKGKWVVPKNIPIPFTNTGIPMPTGADSAAIASRYNALLMGVKNLYELGALTGPDLSIIETQITNPASWAGLLTSDNAMKQQVKVLEDLLSRAEKNLEVSYRQKPGSVTSAATAQQQQPAGAAAQQQQQQPAARPVAQEGATATDRQGRPIVYRNGQWVYQ